MTPIEEQTLRWIDGDLDDEGIDALDRLVRADPSAESVYLELIELELALRGTRTRFDVATRTMATVSRMSETRLAEETLSRIRSEPRPPWARRGRSRGRRSKPRRVAVLGIAGGVLLLAASVLLLAPWAARSRRDRTSVASVLDASRGVVVSGPSGSLAAGAGTVVHDRDEIFVPDAEQVAIESSDGARFALLGPAAVSISREPTANGSVASIALELSSGVVVVDARAPGRTTLIVVRTPRLEARMSRGRALVSTTPASTAVEALHFSVRVTDRHDGSRIELAPEHFIVVTPRQHHLVPRSAHGLSEESRRHHGLPPHPARILEMVPARKFPDRE